MGPGGPTGIIGRYPNGRYPYYLQGLGGLGGGGAGYPPYYGQQPHFGFEGQHNGLNPYSPYNQQFGGGFPFGGPQFDSTSKNSAVKNKVEKSAK